MDYDVNVKEIDGTASLSNFDTLVQDARRRELFIEGIKQQVAEEYDNINNPVPLFSQLSMSAGGRR